MEVELCNKDRAIFNRLIQQMPGDWGENKQHESKNAAKQVCVTRTSDCGGLEKRDGGFVKPQMPEKVERRKIVENEKQCSTYRSL